MKATSTNIPGVLTLSPDIFEDKRGFFFESFNQRVFQEATGLDVNFVQDNHSLSNKGVLRGLHYQLPPKSQGKLVRVISGTIFDVAVDIRRFSPTFGKWFGIELSADNKLQLWLPPGLAHGFYALSESVEVVYKATNYYSPEYERSIKWDDSMLAIKWPNRAPIVSTKDATGDDFSHAEMFD